MVITREGEKTLEKEFNFMEELSLHIGLMKIQKHVNGVLKKKERNKFGQGRNCIDEVKNWVCRGQNDRTAMCDSTLGQ